MPIETRCQGCRKIVRIDERYAGKRARCTHCRTEFVVPAESDLQALDSVCHFCGIALPVGEQADVEFKTCGECQQSIAENDRELEQEALRRETENRIFMFAALAVGAMLALASIGSFFW